MKPTPNQRLGPYRLGELLGQGGMGVVFEARHTATGARYALKILAASADPELIIRFQREGEAQARVDTHPHVLRVHSAGSDAGQHYLVMDLASGGDLAQRLAGGPMAPAEARLLLRDLARGLAHVHAAGILHRDLKPQNALFTDDGRVLLVDFGLAQLNDGQSLTEPGALLGTPAYMAPEQAQGRADVRSDVYGLGAIFYHALTGRPPYTGRSVVGLLSQLANEDPPRPRAIRPEIPRQLERICLRAMHRNPERRYPDATSLALSLEGDEAQDGSATRLLWSAVALVGVLAVALTAAWVGRAGHTPQPAIQTAAVPSAPIETAVATTAEPTEAPALLPLTADVWEPRIADEDELDQFLRDLAAAGPKTTERDRMFRDVAGRYLGTDSAAQTLDLARAMASGELGEWPGPIVLALFRRSAEQGSADGAYGLAKRLWNRELRGPRHAGRYAECLRYYQQAAETTQPDGLEAGEYYTSYGLCLRGAVDDLATTARSSEWLRRGAEAGNPIGMREWARDLLEGRHVTADPEQAVTWIGRAIQEGQAGAAVLLADYTLAGTGVARDPGRARELYALAYARGSEHEAAAYGKFLLEHGSPDEEQTAREVLEQAFEDDAPEAGAYLARHLRGQGHTQRALEWARKAVERGNRGGESLVAELEAELAD